MKYFIWVRNAKKGKTKTGWVSKTGIESDFSKAVAVTRKKAQELVEVYLGDFRADQVNVTNLDV